MPHRFHTATLRGELAIFTRIVVHTFKEPLAHSEAPEDIIREMLAADGRVVKPPAEILEIS
jgi:hypothetical protein